MINPDSHGPILCRIGRSGSTKLIWFKTMIEKQHPPYKIAIFRTDSEPTIVENSTWKEWLEKEGIVHEVAAPYSQNQNGVSERRIGLLGKMTKAMLFNAGLPPGDWYHAMEYATYLLNRTFTKAFPSSEGFLSPHQVFYGGGKDYEPTGVFGCHALAKVYVKGKVAPQAIECIWLGRRENVKADLVRKLNSQRESYSRVTKLNPSLFPGKMKGQYMTGSYDQLSPIESFSQKNHLSANESSDLKDLETQFSTNEDSISRDIGQQGGLYGNSDDDNENPSSNFEETKTRVRVPSLRSVEALAGQLQTNHTLNLHHTTLISSMKIYQTPQHVNKCCHTPMLKCGSSQRKKNCVPSQ